MVKVYTGLLIQVTATGQAAKTVDTCKQGLAKIQKSILLGFFEFFTKCFACAVWVNLKTILLQWIRKFLDLPDPDPFIIKQKM